MKGRSLKDSLTRWTGFPKLESSFEPRSTREAASQVAKLLQDVDPKVPTSLDLQKLYRRLATEWRRTHSLGRVSPRDLRQLPWVLFYPQLSDSSGWLGARPGIVHEYSQWLMHGRRTRSVLALLHEFLRVYPTQLTTFDELRVLLHKALEGGAPSPPASLRKWARRCAHFELLEADRGKQFASDFLSATARPDELLGAAGFDAGLSHCNFLGSGIRAVLPKCSDQLRRGVFPNQHLRQLRALLEYEGKLRFDDRTTRRKMATALLGPFFDRSPPPATKKTLQSFFLNHFGDPRLPSGKHRWAGVPEDARRVVIRWLVERVLEQFFVLLKETAFDKHWLYREAFWRAFLKKGLIDDIWFVLGTRAADILRKTSEDVEEVETTGQLSGAQSDQSVLLLRMPGVTIAEWSHNGSCHMWLEGMRGAPVLYRQGYHASRVRRPYPYPKEYGVHSQRHDGSPSGRWQDAIAQWLRENTEIEIDRDLYFPHRLRKAVRQPPRHKRYPRSSYWRR